MELETRVCRNCRQSFLVEPSDFEFYEKIQVPAPTHCPDCRQQRRYAWRNERILYRRNCDLCGKNTVTIYSPNKPFKVYCPPCWWSDNWDPLTFGREFDFSRPFFEQFREMQLVVPRIALLTKNSVRSEYTNHSNNNKDCYLSFSVMNSENILYSTNVWNESKDCVDCYIIRYQNNLLYECVDCDKCYQCQFGWMLRDSTNCYYSFDCRGCSNCFLCYNLRNKQYCILNTQYTKEEYLQRLEEYRLGSYAAREKLYEEWRAMIRDKALHKYAVIEKSVNSSGNMLTNAKNTHHSFEAHEIEDSKYGVIVPDVKDSMDIYHVGFSCQLLYESDALINSYMVRFSHLSYHNSDLEYCDSCHNSEHLFGCVGLRQKKYCVFNKQYEPEEYGGLRKKIVDYTKGTGEYGEFFPMSLSPFGYNETQAQVYMPMNKEEVAAKGWAWEDANVGSFGKETIVFQNVPDKIQDVADSILQEVLVCKECKRNFNIVKPELDFYRSQYVPIPRLCPHCRYLRKIQMRLPRKLWKRRCGCQNQEFGGENQGGKGYRNTTEHFHKEEVCPNEFMSAYKSGRPEAVYCETCYQAEVS